MSLHNKRNPKSPAYRHVGARGGGIFRTIFPAMAGLVLVAGGMPADAQPRSKGAPTQLSQVKDVRFVDGKSNAMVEIRLDRKVKYRVISTGQGKLLSLEGARLPKLLQRELDTTAFGGPVLSVASFSPGGSPGTVQIRVKLNDSSVRSRLQIKGTNLIWAFSKRPVTRKKIRKPAPEARVVGQYKTQPVAGSRTKKRLRQRYSGRRIDLDFKDADIHNILRLLSDVGNVNVVTSDKVSGRVTIRMKNVPWDQALDVILRAKDLGQVREGNLIRVAPAVDLEKEREAEIARQKQLMLLKPLETRLIPISYASAGKVLGKLKYSMSPRGKLTFDERTNMIIARDTGRNLDLMEKLIGNLDTQTPQVLIETRIVEARSNYAREFGIQWGGSFLASSGTGNSTGLVFPNQIGMAGGVKDQQSPTGGMLFGNTTNPNFAVDLPAAVSSGSGGAVGLTLGSVSGAVNLNLRLSASETIGEIRIVSSPRIITLDNKEASIKSGVSVPYSQVSAQGVQTTFKEAVLLLKVKPHVTPDGFVTMNVEIQRDEPDFVNTGPRGEPTIIKKEAKTQMLVKDGDTAVIGGIYTTRVGVSRRKVPWLGDIPILGYLFKFKKKSTDRTEVLIFITPRIVNQARQLSR